MGGRDLLFGTLGGVVLSGMAIVQMRLVDHGGSDLVTSALEAVRSSPQTAAIVSWSLLDGVQFALGALFFAALVSMVVGNLRLALVMVIVVTTPLVVGGMSGAMGFAGAVAIGVVRVYSTGGEGAHRLIADSGTGPPGAGLGVDGMGRLGPARLDSSARPLFPRRRHPQAAAWINVGSSGSTLTLLAAPGQACEV